MAASFKSMLRFLMLVLSWLPFLVFFSVITFMFLSDFQNPVDEYFVTLILRACLMLILATFFSQLFVLILLPVLILLNKKQMNRLGQGIDFLNSLPIVDIGIYSIGIFFAAPRVIDWTWILMFFLTVSTSSYWHLFLQGPIQKLYVFARFHQVKKQRINKVMFPFYIKTFIDYFFVILKRHLMPLVFILVVMDFKIILPRLVDAGLSYQAFTLFLSLIISLQLLSYGKEIS